MSEKSLELYAKALDNMPQLVVGKKGKARRGGIVNSLEHPRAVPSTKKMKMELQ